MVMEMDDKAKRKHPRMQGYDYSQAGYYYVTICTQGKLPILSKIQAGLELASAVVELSEKGRIVEKQLLALQERYEFARIDKYVIMPTHIHAIVVLSEDAAGASPRPTLTDIICAFKSLSTRLCNLLDNVQGRKIWQASFFEEVIRSESAYLQIWEYIDANPSKWLDDIYFA